jgi:uncharacterized protein (TIGR03435 family)
MNTLEFLAGWMIRCLLLILSAARLVQAQAPPVLDAVSIQANTTPPGGRVTVGGGRVRFTAGMVTGRNVTAKRIILEAYHLTDTQLGGGPAWLDSDRYDLEAKAAGSTDTGQLRLMLQSMLADRFKLVARRETREMAVYVLTVARNGPKLIEVKPGQPIPTVSTKDDDVHHMMDRGTMQYFVDVLSNAPQVGRLVVDKPGLQGQYLFPLGWDEDGDFISAVQDQLGLKFETQ